MFILMNVIKLLGTVVHAGEQLNYSDLGAI